VLRSVKHPEVVKSWRRLQTAESSRSIGGRARGDAHGGAIAHLQSATHSCVTYGPYVTQHRKEGRT
jgi:hypothetical protein